jgi:2-polyprenyl-3-methyl-5-hydroxy-6-metoxy-1,4-benzoquinol methylase
MGKHNFNYWPRVASKGLEIACKYNANRSIKPSKVKATPEVLQHLGKEDQQLKLLDFGCGFGRNAYEWAHKRPNWIIAGYDCVEMLNNSLEYHGIHYPSTPEPENLSFVIEWEKIQKQQFDAVVADNVFGYMIDNEEVAETLEAIFKSSSALIVIEDQEGLKKIRSILGSSMREKQLSEKVTLVEFSRDVVSPVETPEETPAETPEETPAETPEETPAETPTETPEPKKKESEENE